MEPNESNDKEFVRGVVWLGLIIMLAGISLIWMGLYGDPENIHAPRWVIEISGMAFLGAGVGVALMDSMFNAVRKNVFFSWIQSLALLSMPVCLLIAFNWVAFGPGEREFSMSISIPFLSGYFENSPEWLGRLAFGIPTAFMDLIVGGAVLKVVYDSLAAWVNEGEEE